MSLANAWQKGCSYLDWINERFGFDVWMHP
jgi:hypothetical protein